MSFSVIKKESKVGKPFYPTKENASIRLSSMLFHHSSPIFWIPSKKPEFGLKKQPTNFIIQVVEIILKNSSILKKVKL